MAAAMNPSADLWFHVMWEDMHRQSFFIDLHEGLNLDAQAAFGQWLLAMQPMLPCPDCRPHLKAFYDLTPPPVPMSSAPEDYRYARYVWGLHNGVNRRLEKPEISFEAVVDYYVNGKQDAMCAAGLAKPAPVCETPPVPKIAVPIVIGTALLLLLVIIICAVLQAHWHRL
jgi:hypothetical protein